MVISKHLSAFRSIQTVPEMHLLLSENAFKQSFATPKMHFVSMETDLKKRSCGQFEKQNANDHFGAAKNAFRKFSNCGRNVFVAV